VSASVEEIARYLEELGQLVGFSAGAGYEASGAVITNVATDAAARAGDLAWSRRAAAADGYRGALLIAPGPAPAAEQLAAGSAVAACSNPRLAMAAVIGRFFAELTADREPSYAEPGLAAAVAGNDAWVKNATVGCGVRIGPHAAVGVSGMGFERDERGRLVRFPQIGGVLVEDDVEIAAHASVQRGALGDTVLRRGAKIGPHVNIGHNVDVGEDVLIAGHAQVGGGARIGKGATIWQSAAVANGVVVGEGAVVGMSAAVRKDIGPGEIWAGNPARKLR